MDVIDSTQLDLSQFEGGLSATPSLVYMGLSSSTDAHMVNSTMLPTDKTWLAVPPPSSGEPKKDFTLHDFIISI